MALIGLVENCIIRSMVSSVALGPTEQLRPITSTGQASISRVKVSVSVPPGRWPKSSIVTCAITAISLPASFARRHAPLRAVRPDCRRSRGSAGRRRPPAAHRSARGRRRALRRRKSGPSGSMRTPSGPTAPATKAPSLAASRASRTAGPIDVLQLFGDAERGQPLPGGAERVGLQDLGARLDVLLMDLPHHVGRGEVQLVEAAVDEHAARIEHGAHGAIGHHHTAGQLLTELLGSGLGGSHFRGSRGSKSFYGPRFL